MAATKPYYCGRCHGRFWIRTKYCPRCGALTSIPVNVDAWAATQELLYEIPPKMWAMFMAAILLLGGATFYGSLMWRARHSKSASTPPPAQAAAAEKPKTSPVFVEVQSGKIVICDPCGEVVDDRTYRIRVPKEEASRYSVETMHTQACNVCEQQSDISNQDDGAYYGYYNDDRPSAPRPGMAKKLVRSLWGEPIKVEFVRRGATVSERWYFGDPVFGINSNTRYIEFDANGMVAYVRDSRSVW